VLIRAIRVPFPVSAPIHIFLETRAFESAHSRHLTSATLPNGRGSVTLALALALNETPETFLNRMSLLKLFCLCIAMTSALALCPLLAAAASHVTIDSNLVLNINGQKVFPIGFSPPPPPDGKTPDGKNAIEELADAGANFMRTGAERDGWNEQTLQREQEYLNAGARYGLFCMPYLREYARVSSDAQGAKLRALIDRFKNDPALAAWKGADEPAWGKIPVAPLLRARQIIREEDPNHPIVIIQAPRGTAESLRKYDATGDIMGVDIYPVSYPPGTDSLLTNKNISLVGDHARIISAAVQGKQPFWMVLQISWSGVLKPGKTLRFPTFPQERFMTYEAIINGARGLYYFGGANEKSLSARDKQLGWNWTFWKRVLEPVIDEIGTKSPLYPALVAPDSMLPIKASGADGLEFCAREANGELFLIACQSRDETKKVEFSGLPASTGSGDVLYEAPRTVDVKHGEFTDWFAPFEVHVYCFKLSPPT